MALLRHAVLVSLALLTLAPGTAAAIPFGSDLQGPANFTIGCETVPRVADAAGNAALFPSGQPSCTWFYLGRFADPTPNASAAAPGTGRVTAVTVKSGPNPAPLQVTVVRAIAKLRLDGTIDTNQFSCCFFAGESPVFQPTPNATSTFALSLPVKAERSGGFETVDRLGVSALSGTGSLPLTSTGQTNTAFATQPGTPTSSYAYPKMGAVPSDSQSGRTSITGQTGVEVLARFEWCSTTAGRSVTASAAQACAAPGTGPAPGTPVATPPPSGFPTGAPPATPGSGSSGSSTRAVARLVNTVLRPRSRTAIRITCRRTTTCRGRVRLRTLAKNAKALGSQKIVIGAGRSKTYRISLRGSRLSSARRASKLKVEVDLGSAGKYEKTLRSRR
jgi:hypothetical protein